MFSSFPLSKSAPSSFAPVALKAPQDLAGKVALVTGASRGIGAQIAEELAKRGAHLFLTWTPSPDSRASATSVINHIYQANTGVSVRGMPIDLTEPKAPFQVIHELIKYFPHIDIIINNADQPSHSAIPDVTLEHYKKSWTSTSAPPSSSARPLSPISGHQLGSSTSPP